MERKKGKLRGDIVSTLSGVGGILQGFKEEARDFAQTQTEKLISKERLASREDFIVLRSIVEGQGKRIEDLERRIEALEDKEGKE